MPNMIDNIVGIVGPYDRLAELCHAAQNVPASGEINITVCRKKAIEHWGVKWELSDPCASLTCDVSGHDPRWCLDMQFESPWHHLWVLINTWKMKAVLSMHSSWTPVASITAGLTTMAIAGLTQRTVCLITSKGSSKRATITDD